VPFEILLAGRWKLEVPSLVSKVWPLTLEAHFEARNQAQNC
jgi:nitrogen fixation protein